ncbi:hypothetical protein CMV_010401 [Castanea mollissima]|uniref:Uncharacterized protein n=1 Tax=Castanea mollissima TaxID=60419 RepID=A0A8J4R6Y9_9ROSI|nr:hypothetical protein CMV_010401 [Castanea mollissima]
MVSCQFKATHSDLDLRRRSEPDPRLATSTDSHPRPTTTHGPHQAKATNADLKPTNPWSHSNLDLRLTTTHEILGIIARDKGNRGNEIVCVFQQISWNWKFGTVLNVFYFCFMDWFGGMGF